jgi:Ca2+-binding EF-hand superfamily protein
MSGQAGNQISNACWGNRACGWSSQMKELARSNKGCFAMPVKKSTMSELFAVFAAASLTGVAFAQVNQGVELARGGMHFSAREMDANHDGMISKVEFMKYHLDIWDNMTKSSGGSMSAGDVAASFARGGMHINVAAMDADHDGIISRDEFAKYEANHWSLLPRDADGAISVTDMEKAMQAHRREAAAAAASGLPKSN